MSMIAIDKYSESVIINYSIHTNKVGNKNKGWCIEMKMSTKGRYALRLMLDLAIYNTGEPIALKDIAKRQKISEKYLEQIISLLSKAGYVKSVRGPFGGYKLKMTPKEYTVSMILSKAEGDLNIVNREDELEDDASTARATCKVWEQMSQALQTVADHITLADMVEWQREADLELSYQYNI